MEKNQNPMTQPMPNTSLLSQFLQSSLSFLLQDLAMNACSRKRFPLSVVFCFDCQRGGGAEWSPRRIKVISSGGLVHCERLLRAFLVSFKCLLARPGTGEPPLRPLSSIVHLPEEGLAQRREPHLELSREVAS